MADRKNRSNCPVSCSLDIWGNKWSLLIVRDLMFAKQCTYGDFLKSNEKIATNILASRLQTLEERSAFFQRKFMYTFGINQTEVFSQTDASYYIATPSTTDI